MKWPRIIIDILLFIAIFYVPWWLVFSVAIVCVFIFDSYYEIFILGLITDSLYNAAVARYYHFQFVVSLSALIVLIGSMYIKTKLRFYSNR